MANIICEHCTAACCRYVALPIDTPETVRDFDDMRWYVMHQNIAVFVEDGEWYIQIHTPCSSILPDGRCGTYDRRPAICRQYTTGACDYHIGDESRGPYFDNPEELMAYAAVFLGRRKAGAARGSVKKVARAKARRIPKGVRRGGPPPERVRCSGGRK